MKQSSAEVLKNGEGAYEFLAKLVVRHSGYADILAHFEECKASLSNSTEPTCILLTGDTGVGKSTLIRAFSKVNPAIQEPERRYVPVLTGTVPIPATMKNLATELLHEMRDPLADRGTLEQRTRRLGVLIKECGTEILFLDEFQHFIERRSDRVILDVSDWLKNLISNTNIPVVLVGLPEAVRVLDANPQLMRRFSSHVELPAFDFNDQSSAREFVKMLSSINRNLAPMLGGDTCLKPEAKRICAATGGRLSLLMKLLKKAVQFATEGKTGTIKLVHLESAYTDCIRRGPPKENPFSKAWDGISRDPLSKPKTTNTRSLERSAKNVLGASRVA